MSAEALARINMAEWHAAERASEEVEACYTRLFEAIEAAEDAWGVLKMPEARDAERDLRALSRAMWVANYGR